jgi:hypothetical protein
MTLEAILMLTDVWHVWSKRSQYQITKASLAELGRSDDEPRTSASDPYILPRGITVSSSTERDFAGQSIATTWYGYNHLI